MINELNIALRRREIYFIVTFGIILAIWDVFLIRNMGSRNDYQHLPSAYQAATVFGNNTLRLLYLLLIPLISALSYADSYMLERRSGVCAYCLYRQKRIKYFFNKTAVIALISFTLTVFPFVLNQSLCLLLLSNETHTNAQMNTPYDVNFFAEEENYITYPELEAKHPFLTNAIYIALIGLYGTALALLSYAVTLFYGKNRASVIMIPLILALILEMSSSYTSYWLSVSNALGVMTSIHIGSVWPITAMFLLISVGSISAIFFYAKTGQEEA